MELRIEDSSQRCRTRISSLQKGPLSEVGIPLRRIDLGVSQELLYLVYAPTLVDQERCKAVAEIVHPNLRQASPFPGHIPCGVQMSIRLARLGIAKGVVGPRDALYRIQNREAFSPSGIYRALPDFALGMRHMRRSRSKSSHLALRTSPRLAPVTTSMGRM